MAQIELIDIHKQYVVGNSTVTALSKTSLTIDKGDFVSIVGHSGSGKTTLISIIGGILKPSSGKVLFEGSDIGSFDDESASAYRNQKIGFMFQFASLLPILSARDNVLIADLFSKHRQADAESKAQTLLQMMGIGDKVNSYPAQLSGGQQRRVAIARALLNNPKVILADEPTGDLDEETEAEIMTLFKELNEKHQVTIILITHSQDLASQARTRYRMAKQNLIKL
ncbi:MAG: ABC transporter [Deltaproteobacteria bacterium RIFOXYD12_FULL_50_9]|nr:MAG: ABC transporter [Deltaproteobacteria bacterium RIFOXYD12_FULL_50_9]